MPIVVAGHTHHNNVLSPLNGGVFYENFKETWMKTFKIEHLLSDIEEEFTESSPPRWLKHKDFKWFFDENVLTLEVGHYVQSDFSVITRIS